MSQSIFNCCTYILTQVALVISAIIVDFNRDDTLDTLLVRNLLDGEVETVSHDASNWLLLSGTRDVFTLLRLWQFGFMNCLIPNHCLI